MSQPDKKLKTYEEMKQVEIAAKKEGKEDADKEKQDDQTAMFLAFNEELVALLKKYNLQMFASAKIEFTLKK